MNHAWHARLFGLMDFIWWSCKSFSATHLFISIVVPTIWGNKQSKDRNDVMLTVTLGVLVCFSYLSLASAIGLIKATSENEQGPALRIKLCLFWVTLSVISYVISMSYIIVTMHYEPMVTVGWLIFIAQCIYRFFAIYYVYQYIQQLKIGATMSLITHVMIPLTTTNTIVANTTASRQRPPVVTRGRKKRINRPESLPDYEELMAHEKMHCNEASPPKYDAIFGTRV